MRYPNASATQVVFVARGELWTAPRAGGQARRLTYDPGDVTNPRFSPDGRWIAFTGRRAKGRDVYVIPSAGGEPRRPWRVRAASGSFSMRTKWVGTKVACDAVALDQFERRLRFDGLSR